MKAYTQLEIVNSALTQLGEPPMTSLDERNPTAVLVNSESLHAINYVASEYPWKATTVRVALKAPLSGEDYSPVFKYAYPIPIDYMGLIGFYDVMGYHDNCTVCEGGIILSNNLPVYMHYTSSMLNKPIPAYLAEVASAYLAWRLQPRIAASRTVRQDLFSYYESTLSKARTRDAQQGPVKTYLNDETSSLILSRHGLWNP